MRRALAADVSTQPGLPPSAPFRRRRGEAEAFKDQGKEVEEDGRRAGLNGAAAVMDARTIGNARSVWAVARPSHWTLTCEVKPPIGAPIEGAANGAGSERVAAHHRSACRRRPAESLLAQAPTTQPSRTAPA